MAATGIRVEIRESAGRASTQDQHSDEHVAAEFENIREYASQWRQKYELCRAGDQHERWEARHASEVVQRQFSAYRHHQQE